MQDTLPTGATIAVAQATEPFAVNQYPEPPKDPNAYRAWHDDYKWATPMGPLVRQWRYLAPADWSAKAIEHAIQRLHPVLAKKWHLPTTTPTHHHLHPAPSWGWMRLDTGERTPWIETTADDISLYLNDPQTVNGPVDLNDDRWAVWVVEWEAPPTWPSASAYGLGSVHAFYVAAPRQWTVDVVEHYVYRHLNRSPLTRLWSELGATGVLRWHRVRVLTYTPDAPRNRLRIQLPIGGFDVIWYQDNEKTP